MQINMRRVWLGGLIAGLLIIVSAVGMLPLVGNEMDMALARFNLPPLSPGAMIYFAFVSLTLGVVLVWLYAALIPRLKTGICTAVVAALIVWLIGYLLPNVSMVIYGFMPVKLTVIGTAWGLAEVLVGSIIGSRFYKEHILPPLSPQSSGGTKGGKM